MQHHFSVATGVALHIAFPFRQTSVHARLFMDFNIATAIYCFLVAGVFLGLWIYYDRRDHARFEAERRQVSFHCTKCGHLYAIQGESEQGRCPHCGHENRRLRF
jgi:DNA-directed RNA polymerase subunit RPC12/RpoP